MKEYKLVTAHGGRPWHGSELVDMQASSLGNLQTFFGEPGLAAAITGIQVSGTDISPGLAIIQHSTDGWKLVSFAGATGVTFPYYLEVTKTNVNKLYPDTTNQISHTSYTATQYVSGLPNTVNQLMIDADGAVRWENSFGAYATTAWHNENSFVVGTDATIAWNLNFRICKLSNSMQLRGYIDVAPLWSTGFVSKWLNVFGGIEAKYLPASISSFNCGVDYDDSIGRLDSAVGGAYIQNMLLRLTPGGNLDVLAIRDTIGTYRVIVNETIPLG